MNGDAPYGMSPWDVPSPADGPFGWASTDPDGAIVAAVQQAGRTKVLLSLTYQGSVRMVEPYAIWENRDGSLYLVAVRADNGEDRHYRFDRIEGMGITDLQFRPRYRINVEQIQPYGSRLDRA